MLPFHLPGFTITSVTETENELTIQASSDATYAVCPSCDVVSKHSHGWYGRFPQDLPSVGKALALYLRVRRFCCHNEACKKCTFAERLPDVLPVYARRTTRLTALMEASVLECGGEAACRILKRCAVKVSGDTLVRLARKRCDEPPVDLRVVGIDDWAFKKGTTYGTIIVDLERHQVVDLLPDRTQETVAAWLKQHPSIEIVARDRSAEYAAAIDMGAPQAIQVADRWHILVNIRQMVERFLAANPAALKPMDITPETVHLFPPQRVAHSRMNADRARIQAARERRVAVYEAVQALRRGGANISQIARELSINRQTARKYFYATSFPERKQCDPGKSIITPYLPYLHQRVAEGCFNGMQLWREVQQQGYSGTPQPILRWLHLHRTEPSPFGPKKHLSADVDTQSTPVSPQIWNLPSIKQIAWLFVKPPDTVTEFEALLINHLCEDPTVATLHILAQHLTLIVKHQLIEQLDGWLEAGLMSAITQVVNFVQGLQKDYAAIRAALTMVWSNGQTEGQVNRLKFIKRQMYGRAHFDLLRLRVLYHA